MKKYFLTLITEVMCMFLFTILANAETYTVASNSEYQTAYEKAANGDTIIINDELTSDIQATKSITYVLKADWKSARFVINQPDVEVSFIADGGDYRIMPTNYSTTDGWMNIDEAYENVVINLGGINGGTLTIDGTNATHDRVSYVTAYVKLTLNMLKGSAIANFNPTTKDLDANTSLIYARDINMYQGSSVYGNKIVGAPLIEAHNLTLYGGEIFGNLLESTRFDSNGAGAIYVRNQFVMLGGKIHKNIFNAKAQANFNVVGFISTQYDKTMLVLGGEIGDNYVSGSGGAEVSAVFGISANTNSHFYYNTDITTGRRFFFTDTPQLSLDDSRGKMIWSVKNYTLNREDWCGFCWRQTIKSSDQAVAFLDAEKKVISNVSFDTYSVINVYLGGFYAYSGTSTIKIPTGYELWSTSGTDYCHNGKVYTLDKVSESLPIILYSAYNAERVTIDGTTMCSGCGMAYTCNNPEHNLEIASISYGKYTENGTKVLKCNTCGLEKASEISVSPLFTCLGYSAPEDGRGGIAIGYTVNNVAIAEYEEITGKTLKYGVFAVLQDRLGNNDVFADDGTVAEGVINAKITNYEFVAFELKIVGFADEHKDIKLAMGAYVAVTDGETTEYSYLQSGTPNANEKYCFVSFNDIVNAPSTDEEITQ